MKTQELEIKNTIPFVPHLKKKHLRFNITGTRAMAQLADPLI